MTPHEAAKESRLRIRRKIKRLVPLAAAKGWTVAETLAALDIWILAQDDRQTKRKGGL
jgi:hypothetical protein